VLPDAEVSPPVRGRALAVRAEIAFDLQDYDTLVRCATESLELSRASGDDFPVPTAPAGDQPGGGAGGPGRRRGVLHRGGVAAAEAAGNDWEAGLTQATKAAIAVRQGKLKSAQRAYETALEILSDNNRWGVAQVSYGMGTLARTRGDAEMAVRYYADAMEIFRELDAWPEIARCQAGMGWIAVTTGDYDQAQESLAEALRLNQVGGQRLGIARGLEAFAALAAARQQPGRAARLAGAACQLRESLGHGTGIGPRIEEVLEFARGPARRLGRGRPVRRGPRDGRRGRRWLRARPGPGSAPARARGGRRTRLDRPVAADRAARFRVPAGHRRRAPRTHAADPARARRSCADRPGPVQPGDRRRACDQPGDRRPARGQHPGQARLQLAYTSCLMGHPPRRVQLTSACICARGSGS
jgi:tetratricopeptide (TPR) repeat protein